MSRTEVDRNVGGRSRFWRYSGSRREGLIGMSGGAGGSPSLSWGVMIVGAWWRSDGAVQGSPTFPCPGSCEGLDVVIPVFGYWMYESGGCIFGCFVFLCED